MLCIYTMSPLDNQANYNYWFSSSTTLLEEKKIDLADMPICTFFQFLIFF